MTKAGHGCSRERVELHTWARRGGEVWPFPPPESASDAPLLASRNYLEGSVQE